MATLRNGQQKNMQGNGGTFNQQQNTQSNTQPQSVDEPFWKKGSGYYSTLDSPYWSFLK